MKILLFTAHDGSGLSTFIKWQTRSCYAHAAILFENKTVIEAHIRKGVWEYSSHLIDWKEAHIFNVRTTQSQRLTAQEFLRAQLGCEYDKLGVFRFITRQPSVVNARRWFCSELVFAAYQQVGIQLLSRIEPWAVSPGLLALSPLLVKEPTIIE